MTGKMITSLAKSRLRYNKSRTVLTVIAVMLTTTLLMALGTSAFGLLDFNKQQAAANSNIHATLKGVSDSQLTKLSNHADIESMETSEIFATVEYEKMNGFLTYSDEVKDGIYHGVGNLIQGDYAEKADEICGPKAFFKRMGVENPKVGEKINIPFRVMGKGEIQQKEFVISGFVSELDISKMNVSDSRIAYSANISEELIEQYLSKSDRTYNVSLRVSGETKLDYEQMESKINKIADDIGLDKENVSLNKEYLVVMTDPGTDTLRVVIGVALLIIIFSGIVIYSIYYVGVITDVHETGKLKALGATKKQIKKLLRREGAFVAGISIPLGLVLGYL
ncbi:MAG: ABC transporter permease, partial [Anaerovoracaceae bacterium]